MEIVADASVFLAVVLNEIDRGLITGKTHGAKLASPEILPYEIGKALTAMIKRRRINADEALAAYGLSQRISVRLLPVRISDAIKIAARFNLYAYDAFYLQCCVENKAPLISLDGRMIEAARSLRIPMVE